MRVADRWPSKARPRKVRVTHWLDRWLVNPVVRTAAAAGLAPRAIALLETTGSRTGKRRVVPVLNGTVGDDFWVFAQDGWWCAYVRNAAAEPRVRVKVRGTGWRDGTAAIAEEAGAPPDRKSIGRQLGLVGAIEGKIFRSVSTQVVPMRIRFDSDA